MVRDSRNDITVNATVVDEDTMRYGGSEFVRVIRCRDCKHYIPEETWREERGIGLYETVGEPPSCKKWSYIILGEDGKSSVYRPDGFCAWAERDM